MTADELSMSRKHKAVTFPGHTAKNRRMNPQRFEDLALRRMKAHPILLRWYRTRSLAALEQYVHDVGDGGTLDSDFRFRSHEPERGRPSLWPECWHCGARKHWSSFKLTAAEWETRGEHQRQGLPVEPMWHGRSHYCSSCRIERESDEYRRYWHPHSTALARRGSSRPTESRPPFGAHIRQMREARGWSQSTLAAKAGMSARQIANLERGGNQPRIATVMCLARALDVPEKDLASG